MVCDIRSASAPSGDGSTVLSAAVMGPAVLLELLAGQCLPLHLLCRRSYRATLSSVDRRLSDHTGITWRACAESETNPVAGCRAVACGSLCLDTAAAGGSGAEDAAVHRLICAVNMG